MSRRIAQWLPFVLSLVALTINFAAWLHLREANAQLRAANARNRALLESKVAFPGRPVDSHRIIE